MKKLHLFLLLILTTNLLNAQIDLSSPWGVVGSATPGGWAVGGPDLPFYSTDVANVFVAYVTLTDGEIKFRQNNDWVLTSYGDTGADGTLESIGGDNIIVSAGSYKIVMNLNAPPTYTMETYLPWGIVGDATPNGWGGPDIPLNYDASGQWSAEVSFIDGAIKFRESNDWVNNYGDFELDGILDAPPNASNIPVEGGHYLVSVDFNSLAYSVVPLPILIPDQNFEQALIDLGIDTNGLTGDILINDAEVVTILDVGNKNISDLTGIEGFTSLTELICHNNQLTSLDMTKNIGLTSLNCNSNQLESLNIKNGNNLSITDTNFQVNDNPSLFCITVDNSEWSTANWNNIDVQINFTENCSDIFNNWGVVGSFNGWGTTPDAELIYNPLTDKWHVDVTLIVGQIKFRANSNWSNNYGDNGADGTLDINGENIAIAAGDYFIVVDFNSSEYFIYPLVPILYVNDTNQTDDVYTTAIGDDANPGSEALPFATIQQAINRITIGGEIYIDAGTYTEQVTITKGVTIIGAGQDLTSVLIPAVTNPPPGPFTEKGVIQTAQNIGDVYISYLTVTGEFTAGVTAVTPLIIQSGGSVKNCRLQNGNQGIFFRIESAIKTAVVENNIISAEFIGVNFAGSGLTASLINNNIIVAQQGFSVGAWAGLQFGPVVQFTATGNTINNYVTSGLHVNSFNSNITQNSIVGNGGFAIEQSSGNPTNATCNWYGVSDPASVAAKINGAVNYEPWLVDGTDDDPAIGFQPLAGVCNGTIIPVITLDAVTNIDCFGSNNGTINISVTGGLGPFTFAWTKDEDAGFNSANEDLTGLAPGSYNLLLTDADGSTASLNDTSITEPSDLTAQCLGSAVLCNGDTDGTVSVTPGGGTPPYTYLWNDAGAQTGATATGLGAGTYMVTVTDDNGCTETCSADVTEPSLLTASIENNSTACSNNATVTADGGTPGYTYLWSNGELTDTIANVPVGTYDVTVTDANGCFTTAIITLTVGEAFNPSASVTNVSCFGDSNGVITVTNANGTAPFEFSKDGITFLAGEFPYSFNDLSAGTYDIAVRDTNGCTGFITKTISQPAELSVTLVSIQGTCSGQSTGSISVATAGGTGGLSYSWTEIGGYTSSQKNIGGLAIGSYSLTVTDNNGCTALLDADVPTSNEIVVSETITNVLCRGTLTGSIDLSVSGGSGSVFTYSWTGNITSTSEDISNLGSGTNYNVTITDTGSGCTVSESYIITQPASNLSLASSKSNATGCEGGTIIATASGGTFPYEYSLDVETGTYQQINNEFSGLLAGTYNVEAKDSNGCTTSIVVAITDNGKDQYESNNSKKKASLIEIGTTINARIGLSTDVDWFKFVATAGDGSYTLNLSHQAVNYTFELYDSSKNSPVLVPTSSTTTSKQYALLTGGATYYVQITGALSFNCYDLSIFPVANARYASTNTEVIAINELSVKAWPNPSDSSFNIKLIPINSLDKVDIKVFDITNKLVHNNQFEPNQEYRFGERLEGGVYFVKIKQANKVEFIRLIKF